MAPQQNEPQRDQQHVQDDNRLPPTDPRKQQTERQRDQEQQEREQHTSGSLNPQRGEPARDALIPPGPR